jgi:biopolymer transport protein ExbB
MNQTLGLAHYWSQGDAVSHTVAYALLLMSVASWYYILSKTWSSWRIRTSAGALEGFWKAPTLSDAIATIKQSDGENIYTLLASVGATAPFVGLVGTVWGIYHALIAVSSAGTIQIDKIAGPVGEALIMTALGLVVAIPAVLGYNAFTRVNRVTLAELDAFAHDLHAYLTTGARIGK